MNIKDIASFIFGDGETGFVVFDEAEDRVIDDLDALDEDALLLDMPDGQLDFIIGDEVFAVATDLIDIADANIVVTKGDRQFGVFVLEDPISPDDYDGDIFAVASPVGLGWEYEIKSDELYGMGDLLARVSEPAPLPDEELEQARADGDTDNETTDPVHEVQVSPSDVDGDEGESAPVEEDGQVELTEVAMMNDAELLGEDHPEMQELLQQDFTFMTGSMYGQKDRRNTQDGDWVRAEMPLLRWLVGEEKGKGTWGLTRHPVAKSKEGASIVLAESIGGGRSDSSIQKMSAIGLDIDSGAALNDVLVKIEELGLFAIVYTSYSHGKSELVLKHDDIMRKLKLDESPNRSQIQQYLIEHHKDRYDPEYIDTIEVVEIRKQTKDGLRTVLKTKPLDKFRVIFPLWEAVELADLAPTVSKWKDVWADAVCGLAVNMLDVSFDATSCDVNRLFFTPRHPADAEDWYCAVVQGKPLRFEDITPYSKTSYIKNRDPGDAFAMGTDLEERGQRDTFMAPGGTHLNKWHTKHKERWLAADVIEQYCGDKIRTAGGEKVGTVHHECPFEHEHSSEGGTATMAMNPDANSEHGFWTVFCRHDACQGRDKLEFVQQMLEDGWFPEEALTDEDFNYGLTDEELAERDEQDKKEAEAETPENLTPAEEAAKFDKNSSEADIKRFMKRHHRMGADMTVRGAIKEILSVNTHLKKRDIEKIWKDLDAEKRQRDREDGTADSESNIPITNEWHFGDMVEWGNNRIKTVNAEKPRLFHYIDEIARIEENADALPRIRMLTEKQFAAELNSISKWVTLSTMGDMVRKREVAAPADVVSHLYSTQHMVYPKLRSLVTTPTFTAEGELVTEHGYHPSGLYYHKNHDLDIPTVNRAPTEEEVAEAKRLLVEEAFADFPLGGLTRVEIVEQALHGDGVPAVTNLIGMLLLMFCRDLVDGPTPGHLLTKPSPGTGASLLTDVCSIIANGEVTPALTLPSSKEEMQKTLITLMADGSNIVYFDNIDTSIDSGELASALTAPKVKGRILGKSQSVEAEVRAVWVLCGNNVRLSSELLRRLIMIDLNARIANPELRSGWRHDDIRGWVTDNRGALVWACLTLVQNWVAKGMKTDSTAILNSYENWSRVMGGILRDAGLKGFLDNRDELKDRASDSSDDDIGLFLDTWWENYIDTPILMRSADKSEPSLIDMAIQNDLQLPIRLKKDPDDNPTYDPRLFGKFLGTYEGRVLCLSDGTEVEVDKVGKRAKNGYYWKLNVMKPAPKGNVE